MPVSQYVIEGQFNCSREVKHLYLFPGVVIGGILVAVPETYLLTTRIISLERPVRSIIHKLMVNLGESRVPDKKIQWNAS